MKKAKRLIAIFLAVIMVWGCFSLIGSAEEIESTEHLTEVSEGYVGIYTKDDLDNIKLDMAGKYILMNDIVFEDSDYEKGGNFYNSGKGWEPIGTESTNFRGTFDGNGYKIKNLYINNPEQDYVGLFGYGYYSTIKNVILENLDITGNNYVGGIVGYSNVSSIEDVDIFGTIIANNNVGGLVGYMSYNTIINSNFIGNITSNDYVGGITGYSCDASTISNCNVQGSVRGSQNVGGIVGYQNAGENRQTNYNFVKYCSNAAIINGSTGVGGIVGTSISNVSYSYGNGYYCYGISNIQYCSNGASVTATNSSAGGIAGITDGDTHKTTVTTYYAKCTINSCYNSAEVEASNYTAGGIVGGSTNTDIGYCYSVGEIKSATNFGGCFGTSPSSSSFCYYLEDVVVNPTCTAGIAKSEDQMKKQTAYEKWDFNTVWTMNGREDYPYPELKDVPLIFPEDSIPHEHTYTSEITKEATHLEEGVMTYTCECGDTYTEVIAKITEHTYNTITTVPTCTNRGYTTYICECGHNYIDDYIDAMGHDFTDWTVVIEPDCITHGEEYRNCSKCGKKEYQYADALGHDFESVVTAPTCTEQGYTTYTCECGESYNRDYVSALDHLYTSEITTPATHMATGVMTYTCGCGDTYTETIAKITEHTYVAVVTVPTCEDKGYTTYTCECGYTYIADYVDALGHTPASAVEENYIAPNCTENGGKDVVVYCSVCNEEISRETVTLEATGHADNDGNGYCDEDNELLDSSIECDCNCHKSGVSNFFFKFALFFQKLFGSNKECACGIAHY